MGSAATRDGRVTTLDADRRHPGGSLPIQMGIVAIWMGVSATWMGGPRFWIGASYLQVST
ncbi:MAG TPA: hypothetical protein VNM67_24625 [Thermoanaerobaculia bacterium]|jgi:hypothetical protein|nr:hypothetical protein [Thermoanaerobaculia bacterium]